MVAKCLKMKFNDAELGVIYLSLKKQAEQLFEDLKEEDSKERKDAIVWEMRRTATLAVKIKKEREKNLKYIVSSREGREQEKQLDLFVQKLQKREESESFLNYVLAAREEFVKTIRRATWNVTIRTASEDILIAYDQMASRLKEKTKGSM